jgi:hypothetical protein
LLPSLPVKTIRLVFQGFTLFCFSSMGFMFFR